MSISVTKDKCTGCTLCIKVCPFSAIEVIDKMAIIDLDKCNLCGACLDACKFDAIIIEKKTFDTVDASQYKGVWVFCEQRAGKLESVSFELLGEGRKLADKLGVELSGVVLGHKIDGLEKEIISRGADNVYMVDNEKLVNYLPEPYTKVLEDLVEEFKPEIFLAGATSTGRSLLSRVAIRTNAGLTADCTALAIDDQKKILLQTRPAFGGNIMATIISPRHRPQMATVRHKVMKEPEVDGSRQGKVIKKEFAAELLTSRTEVLDIVEEVESTINLTEADIIVSGGRAVGSPEGFKLVREFAEVVGAAVGASRATVDAGWIPYSHQVGQTGKTVCPKIYFACGISGQIQHLAGMQSSDIIIAINKDPDAPIFKVATFGIVGDIFEYLPLLIEEFKKIRQK